ncbi:MAG: FAD-binding protein [Ilumatobacteraceae bacterium]|nr:FAD-binding protein [Ilumatobacteraceae bacterium]
MTVPLLATASILLLFEIPNEPAGQDTGLVVAYNSTNEAELAMATWKNWAGNQIAHPLSIEKPRDERAVAQIVRTASDQGEKVKVVGSGHSFTSIALTNGRLISIDALSGIASVDSATKRVTVHAGTTLADLNVLLDGLGLALPNLGDITYQTVAGAISTGTHGTGQHLTGLAGQVVGMRFINAMGEVVEANESTNPEILRLGRVGLGALGVLTQLTLQAVLAFHLRAVETPMRVDKLLEEIEMHVNTNDHFEFFWVPHTGWALTKRNNRTDDAVSPQPAARRWIDKVLIENYGFGAVCAVGRMRPQWIPRLAKALPSSGGREYVDTSYKVFASTRLVKFYEMEYSIPRAHIVDALNEVRTMVDRRGHLLNFPVEVRFTKADDMALSTSYGRDSAYIAVHIYKGMDYVPYFKDVEAIMKTHQGRPHWGKLHFRTAQDLAPAYPLFDQFVKLRNQMDPTRTFANEYTDRVLDGSHV